MNSDGGPKGGHPHFADPIFIIGPQRSGTTLLRLILDAHPDVAAGPESGFMRAVEVIKNIPDFHGGEGWYEGFGFTEVEFERHIADFYRGVFSDFASREGKKRWAEKTPFHRFYVPELARMFSDARFVGVTRHPGAVAASRKKWGYDVEPVLDDWVASMRRMFTNSEALGEKRFQIVRYEDLVTTPREVLSEILGFLDLPWSENVMRHDAEQAAKGAPDVTTGGTRPKEAIAKDRVDGWLDDLSSDEMALLGDVDYEMMTRCGYRPEIASERGPLVV